MRVRPGAAEAVAAAADAFTGDVDSSMMPVVLPTAAPVRAASIGRVPSATYTTLLGRPRVSDSATTARDVSY